MDAGADVSKESQDVGLDWVSCDLAVGQFAYLRRQRGPEQGWSGVQRMWRAECTDGAQEQHRRTALRLAEWTGRAVVRTAVDRGLALPAGLAWCGWGGSWRLAWSPHCGAHCHMWHKAGAAACCRPSCRDRPHHFSIGRTHPDSPPDVFSHFFIFTLGRL